MRTPSDDRLAAKTGRRKPDDSFNDITARKANIDAHAMYRVACVGFDNVSKDMNSAVGRAFARIFDGHNGARLALLSGVVPAAQSWPRAERQIRSLAKEHGVSVLAEVKASASRPHYRAYDPTGEPLPVAMRVTDDTEDEFWRWPLTSLGAC